MRRSALPVVLVACAIVAAVLAWLVVQRMFLSPSGRPDAPAVAETRALAPFTRIEVTGQLDVEIVQGDRHEVGVEAPPGEGSRIRTDVSGDTLQISARNVGAGEGNRGSRRSSDRVVVRAPAIEAIALAGTVQLTAPSLAVPSLAITAAGATSLRIDALDVESLRIRASGAVKAELAGRATEVSIGLSGAGSVRAPDLVSQAATVDVSGAGSVVVRAEKSLRVDLSGAGLVEYLGNPEVTRSVSGLGRIKRREATGSDGTRARLRIA